MLLNEHRSKEVFREAGVAVPPGELVGPETAASYAPSFAAPWYCKAQVLAGGRGKAGGIRRADTPEALRETLQALLAMEIKGHAVPLVRVEPATDVACEFYCSFAVARGRERLVLTVGRAGGVDVESSESRKSLLLQDVSACAGLRDNQVRAAFFHLLAGRPELAGRAKELWPGFRDLLGNLHAAVRDYGLLLAEVNPLVLTGEGAWLALDGKVEVDDNVRDLRPELERFYQPEHASAEENAAREAGLSYLELQGWVGLLVNGAGLAMATMDLLNLSDLPAANFMDLGGAADQERMGRALELLFGKEQVHAAFINLFGGIVSCETVANALAGALSAYPGNEPPKPLVVRMAGNGADAGRAILQGLGAEGIHIAGEMQEALDALRGLRPAGPVPQISFQDSVPPVAAPPVPACAQDRAVVPARPLGLDADTKVLVQGITGRAARHHVALMQEYGTRVVAGVTPFKGGGEVLGVPVYDSVRLALEAHPDVGASIVFVPGGLAADAILEAADAGVPCVVCITEGIPQQHMLAVREAMRGSAATLIGPNTPGVIVPGRTKLGIMPGQAFAPGPVAVFSRSGTLTYETAARLSAAGIGQSLCVGVGGDPFIGARFKDLLEAVRHDPNTEAVVVLGEIGGSAEEELAAHIAETGFPKPVVAFVAGRTAPPGKRLGHAGAILEEGGGGIQEKMEALAGAGIAVCPDLERIPETVAGALAQS